MADASFGGRAIPGIQVTVGQSKQQVQGIVDALRGLEQMLDEVRRTAQQTAQAVNGITAPKTGGGRAPKPPAAGAERNIFAGIEGNASMTEAQWREIGKKQQKRREEALMSGMDLNANERKTFSRTRSILSSINSREGHDTNSLLARLVNGAGWAPGMPSQMYLAQMALGEMGLGLSLPLVAGGMGALGLGVAGLGLNAAVVDQNRTGEQMAAQLGAPPTFVTGSGVAQQMGQLAQQFHLSGQQPEDIAAGLVAGGLDRQQALGPAFAQVANLVNVFGMSIKDATDLVSRQYTDLGKTTQDVTGDLQALAGVALATGLPASGIAAVLSASPNLQANVGGTSAGAAAAIFRSIYGSNAQASTMAEVANAHGAGAYALAGMLGMGVDQLDQLRSTTAGQGQVVDLLNARARAAVAQNGPEAGFEQFNAMLQAAGGQPLAWDAFQRAISAAPNAGAAAAQKAKFSIYDTYTAPGSASSGLSLTAKGDLSAGAQAAQPWNVKDMAVNAASVTLAGFGNAVQGVGTVLSGQANAATLQQIAAQGGPQGEAANLALGTVGGDGQALLAAYANLVGFVGSAIGAAANPGGGQAAAAGQSIVGDVIHRLELTLNLRPNNQPTTTKINAPLPNSSQAYQQYTPRGQQ